MANRLDREVYERATGIKQVGNRITIKCEFQGEKKPVSYSKAKEVFLSGGIVYVGRAGAGTFIRAFNIFGFYEYVDFDNTSSAGDWWFAIKSSDGWCMAYQSNQYPNNGFSYKLCEPIIYFDTQEELLEYYN